MIETTLLNENENSARPVGDFGSEAEQCVRENPGLTFLAALAFGLAIAALVFAFRPAPKPQHRLSALLRDIEDRLHDVGAPALRRAGAFAAENAHAIGDGVHRGEAKVERFVRDAGKRMRRFWS